jgi:PAS domain S-box-containing protein
MVLPGRLAGMIGPMAPLGDKRDPRTWRTDVAHLDGLNTAAVAADAAGALVYCNPAAENLLSRSRGDLLGQTAVDVLLPEDHRGGGHEVFSHVLGGAAWSGRLPFSDLQGAVTTLDVTATPLRHEGKVVGVLFVLEDASEERVGRGRQQRVAARLARLARVTGQLVAADDLDSVTKIVISEAADAVGATVATMMRLLGPETIALVGVRAEDTTIATRWSTFPMSLHTPAADAIRSGEPLLLTGRSEIETTYPDLESAAPGERTLAVLPLMASGRALGAISLSFPGKRTFDSAEREFLRLLSDTCAQAMDRIQARQDAEEQAYKLRFLTEASAELASSLDYHTTLRNVAHLGVPEFADWCTVSLLEDGDLRTLAVAHADPEKVAYALELQKRFPPDPDAPSGAWNVVRTGRSELIPEITDEVLEAITQDEELLRVARELDLRSTVSAPLAAHGKVLGVMTWVSGSEGRRFSETDLAFVEDVAQRAAVAIDNSELHSQTREAAVRLQRAVLPDVLPEVSGWQFASYYSPSGRTEVGGDFYDVLPVQGGVALFVGDVMGRGVSAAAAMAQMRAAIRSYVALDPTPESVVGNLDTMFEKYEYTQLVTLAYVLVDGSGNELHIVNAGHPPPLVLHADGGVDTVSETVTAPLGLGLGPQDRRAFRVPFQESDTLLLYTDGLIERRGEDIDIGQGRLAAACSTLRRENLHECLQSLVESVRDHTREDDVAALAARRLPTS